MTIADILAAASDESAPFREWIAWCLKWECETDATGRIKVEALGDGAGLTFAGLTSRDDGLPNDPHDLSPSQVVDAYYENYWKPTEGLPSKLQPIIGNYNLNIGARGATKLLQRSLQDFSEEVIIDGVMGDQTRAAAFRVSDQEGLANAVISKGASYYKAIAIGGKEKWLTGWLNRNNDLRETFA